MGSGPPTTAAPPAARGGWLIAGVIALLGFLFYAQTTSHQYTLDDLQVVQHNPVINEGRYVDALSTSYWPEELQAGASNWRPLATFSWTVERAFGGPPRVQQGIPTGGSLPIHHGLNALLHGLLVLALFPLARRLCGGAKPAWLACALFALHPAHTEAVAPVVGRTDLLAALGALLALEWWMRHRESGDRRWLAAAATAFAMGLAGKESAAPVLLLLPLADRWLLGRPWADWKGRAALALTPLLGVALLYGIARIAVLGSQTLMHAGATDLGLIGRLGFVGRNTVLSSGLLVAPVRFHHVLTTLPSDAEFTFAAPGTGMSIVWVMLALPIAFGWIALARRAPRAAFCWVAALAFWAPTSGLLPAAAGMSLRFLLLPSAFAACGAVMGGVALLQARPQWRNGLLSVVAVWAGIAGALTLSRVPKWANNRVFYEALLRERADCYTANYGLGAWHATREGDLVTARRYFLAAIETAGDSPRGTNARMNLAKTYEYPPTGGKEWGEGSDVPEAIRQYEAALQISPDTPAAHLAVGRAHGHLGHAAKTVMHFRRVLELQPGSPQEPELLGRCGELELSLARPDAARADFRAAARARETRAADYDRRGRAPAAANDRRLAVAMLRKALECKPDAAEAAAIAAEIARLQALGR